MVERLDRCIVGRCRRTLEIHSKIYIKETRWEVVDWLNLAYERGKQQAAVKAITENFTFFESCIGIQKGEKEQTDAHFFLIDIFYLIYSRNVSNK